MWKDVRIFFFRESSQALAKSNCVLCNLCCHTSLIVVAAVALSRITGKYTGCCGQLNSEPVIIRYRDGRMTRTSRPLPPPPRSLWTEPAFFKAWNGPHVWIGRLFPLGLWLGRESRRRTWCILNLTCCSAIFLWGSLLVSSTLCGSRFFCWLIFIKSGSS